MNIELINVWYRYSKSKDWALKEISITFRSSEIVYIDGHNGSGKTTLLKIASLMYRPTKGFITINNKNFWSLNEEKKTLFRRRVVYVHEKPILLRGTVLDNILYGLRIRGIDIEEALDISLNILSMFGIDDLINKPIQKLSTGQAQLVAIARALAVKPDILFLDEPFSNLDKEKRKAVINILNEFQTKGMGIVFSSHNIDIDGLSRYRRIVLENGVIASIYE